MTEYITVYNGNKFLSEGNPENVAQEHARRLYDPATLSYNHEDDLIGAEIKLGDRNQYLVYHPASELESLNQFFEKIELFASDKGMSLSLRSNSPLRHLAQWNEQGQSDVQSTFDELLNVTGKVLIEFPTRYSILSAFDAAFREGTSVVVANSKSFVEESDNSYNVGLISNNSINENNRIEPAVGSPKLLRIINNNPESEVVDHVDKALQDIDSKFRIKNRQKNSISDRLTRIGAYIFPFVPPLSYYAYFNSRLNMDSFTELTLPPEGIITYSIIELSIRNIGISLVASALLVLFSFKLSNVLNILKGKFKKAEGSESSGSENIAQNQIDAEESELSESNKPVDDTNNSEDEPQFDAEKVEEKTRQIYANTDDSDEFEKYLESLIEDTDSQLTGSTSDKIRNLLGSMKTLTVIIATIVVLYIIPQGVLRLGNMISSTQQVYIYSLTCLLLAYILVSLYGRFKNYTKRSGPFPMLD